MPKLSGAALLKAKAEGKSTSGSKGGRKAATFTPLFNLRVGETAYIQFPREDDLEEVFLHTWVRVPPKTNAGKDRGYDWETFASRTRNPEFGDDYSVLEEELDHWPVKKLAGIVVILEPQFDGKGEAFKNLQGFELAGNTVIRDDKEVFYPRWNLVFEAYQTFWENTLQIYNSVGYTSHPIQVTRVASDSYQFMAVQNHDAIDLEPYMDFIPTVTQEIERLGSEERYDEYFGEGKQRIENQGQKHNWLPQWLQDERAEKRGEEVPVEEPEETPDPPKSKTKKKSKFDDLADLTKDEAEEVVPY